MRVVLAAYLLFGGALGLLWNRAELGRVPLRRLAPSFCAFVVAWPLLAAGTVAVAAVWTRIWRKTHERDHPAAPPQNRAASPRIGEDAPNPHPL